MIARAVAMALVAIVGLAAEPGSAEEARLPRPRPVVEPPAPVAEWADAAVSHFSEAEAPKASPSAAAAIERLAPLPRPRPERPAEMLAMVAPEARPAPPAPDLAPSIAGESNSDFAACLQDLRTLGVAFEIDEPIDDEGGCNVPHPLTVTDLGSGVSVGPETVLNCAATRALAEWVRDVLVPSGERTLGAKPAGIRQDSAYVCRHRYNNPRAKISEHARANAIDIAEFEFDGRNSVDVGRNAAGSPEARFVTAARAGSCRYFTTVLGPGSNAAHATHFHFDLAQRRGGYRLCELGPPPLNTKRE